MKNLLRVLCFVLVLAFMLPHPVHAGDYVSEAVAALQTSNVYVAPGTPGTDNETAAKLKFFLKEGDGIVLVMLPAEAMQNTNIFDIARSISEGLNNQKIIGLAVGKELIGYSVLLPEGTVTDMMDRAENITLEPVSTLITFSQYAASWVAKNPLPTPFPTPRPTMQPIELPKIDVSTTQGKASIGFLILVLVIAIIILAMKVAPRLIRNMKFRPAEEALATIESLLPDIGDRDVKRELTKACKLAHGLLDIFKKSSKYIGIVEDLFPPLLDNIVMQISALINHESGVQPISDVKLEKMIKVMLNYDDLFRKLQENDPETVDLLASIFMSENAIVSNLGYFPTKKE